LAKLSPARQAVEISRIEAQMAPHGHVNTGTDRLWKSPAVRGRISDEDWARTAGEGLSDAAWNREFDRRMKERDGRPHRSTEAEKWAQRVKRG
jgi:hypothetical protein